MLKTTQLPALQRAESPLWMASFYFYKWSLKVPRAGYPSPGCLRHTMGKVGQRRLTAPSTAVTAQVEWQLWQQLTASPPSANLRAPRSDVAHRQRPGHEAIGEV
jgi:hypothetical protein